MISVDPSSAVPPFEQVRSQFAAQIVSGELPVGSRLPTVRSLAVELGLAANTVARAITELEQAGLVTTRGRAGTFVSASGDTSRIRLAVAAGDYAALAKAVGVDPNEALGMIRAALEAG